MKQLSVIIVNYNGQKFIKNCLNSLYDNLIGIDSEIIIVDNNSTDSSCTLITETFPNVRLFALHENLGFGKGNNIAVSKATGQYVLLLNIDTIIQSSIQTILNILKNDHKIGALSINMRDANNKYIHAAGNFPTILNMFKMSFISCINTEFKTGNFLKNSYTVDWLCGAFILLPKSVYEIVGGFDEDYFMYVEDVDLCKKIANLNLHRVFIPSLSYTHFVGFNSSKNPYLINGYKIYIKKHTVGLKRMMLLFSLDINSFVKMLKIRFKKV